MRLRGAGKETMEEAGIDTTGMSTRKDLVKIMKNVAGVDLMKDANSFKSTFEILDELAGKWNTLTDLQKAKQNRIALTYRNMRFSTYLKPVKPKALLLQCG